MPDVSALMTVIPIAVQHSGTERVWVEDGHGARDGAPGWDVGDVRDSLHSTGVYGSCGTRVCGRDVVETGESAPWPGAGAGTGMACVARVGTEPPYVCVKSKRVKTTN